MSETTAVPTAPASGDGMPIPGEIRARRRMRAGSGLVIGGLSGATVTTAAADLVIAWWPWVATLPLDGEAEGALRTLIVAAGTIVLGALGGLVQMASTRFTRLGEE
jgi:hypothetical protein